MTSNRNMSTTICCFCETKRINKNIGGDDFVLLSCGCISCPKCIIMNTINRKSNPVKCIHPEHQQTDINKLNYFFSSRENPGGSKKIPVINPVIVVEKEPVKYFMTEFEKDETAMKDTMILNLVYASKRKSDKSTTMRSAVSILNSKNGFESKEDMTNLRTIFSLLHDPIMKHHTLDTLSQKSYPRMTPAEFCQYCTDKDSSVLLQLLYALATGYTKYTSQLTALKAGSHEDNKAKEKLSNFLAVCVAKGMIERINLYNTPGPFQLMIADMLSLVNAPNPMRDFLSKIRVSIGRRTIDRNNIRNEIVNLRKRIVLKPTEAFSVSYDNFSFDGDKGRHAMHTIIQIMIISEKRLKKLGFYNPNVDERISRKTKTFEELLEEYDNDEYKLANNIVIPNKDDYDMLAKRIFKVIKTVVLLKLPTVEQCRDMLTAADEVLWPEMFPSNLGVMIETSNSTKINKTQKEDQDRPLSCSLELLQKDNTDEDDDDVDGKTNVKKKKMWQDVPLSFYEKNNVQMEVLHGDPGADHVMKMMMDYLNKASHVDVTELEDERLCGEEPVRHIIAPATADGGPARRWLDFQALDINRAEGVFENREYKRTRVFFAGFHYMMEFLSMRGSLCRDLTSFFASKWRHTEKGLDWIYKIRNPNDGLTEWREYLMAHYVAASESCGSKNARDVHLYMLKRSVEKPLCQGILFDLRLLEICFMIRDSEKSGTHGDVPLFLTCLRFSMPLFTITHAINYCYLVCEFLEWYKLASDAEMILFENFFYTKLSVGGKPIWADRGVEWTVNHIRSFMGRRMKHNKHHDRVVDRTVADLPFRLREKAELRYILNSENHENYSTADWNDQKFFIGKAFLTTRVALSDTNFWGPGNFRGELEEPLDGDCIIIPDPDGKTKEFQMSSSILGGYEEIGIPRTISYYVTHHCQNRYRKTRSENPLLGVCLKALPTTHARRAKDIEITKLIQYSCDASAIKKLIRDFPMTEVVDEIEYYRKYIQNIPNKKELKNMKRPALVTCLCKFRRKYFDTYPEDEKKAIASVAALEKNESATTQKNRLNQITTSRLYYLDDRFLDDISEE